MKKILISNDDGVLAPGIFAAKEAVKDLGEVIVVAPQENNSGVGRRLSMFKHINLKKYEMEDGFEAYGVSGSPADSVIVGANYVLDEKPDIVITGINTGINISKNDITSSGTVCAALEAVAMGIPAISASVFLDYSAFKQDENGEWYIEHDFSLAKKILHDLCEKVLENGMPEGVDLFNLNVPSDYESEEPMITTLSDKMLVKDIMDENSEDENHIFSFSFEDDKRSFQLEDGEEGQIVMITSALCDDYEKGSDGYCLMVDKRPSITPLNVDMTRDVSSVERWYEE